MANDRRKWFQIHLSTAIVLMFVAGGLIWANMETESCWYPTPLKHPDGSIDPEYKDVVKSDFVCRTWGWPGLIRIIYEYQKRVVHTDWRTANAYVNILIWAFILFGSAFLMEFAIRRSGKSQ